MEEHETALEPPLKKAKTDKLSVMGDKQKALRTIALGGFSASLTEQAVQAATSAGQVCVMLPKLRQICFLEGVQLHNNFKVIAYLRPSFPFLHDFISGNRDQGSELLAWLSIWVIQVDAVIRTMVGTVEEAAKLRHDGCTGKIILITYNSVSLQHYLYLTACRTLDAWTVADSKFTLVPQAWPEHAIEVADDFFVMPL